MKYGGCRDCRMHFGLLPLESFGGGNGKTPQGVFIWDLDAPVRPSDFGIENGSNITDRSCQRAIGISIETYFSNISQVNGRKVVFIDVADHPNVREIGDGKSRRRP